MHLPLAALLCLTVSAATAAEPSPDFARDVRPILSNYCFKCHGPDEAGRKGGLRLDQRSAALAPAKSGARAVVPSHPDDSELISRILSDDPDEVMPPPSAKQSLTPQQKETLRQWIGAGAPYKDHWAFLPPARPPVPADAPHPIDAFVHARLRKEGLTPSPQADPATLLRRVSLDLTGLPPSPEEVAAFAAGAGASYEATVDRLLASRQYGERWARKWLDLARYADTNGYEKDRPREIWPYRDWVVRSLNADMPFDQFTVAQLAGDLLPGSHPDNIIATGFHRNTMLNEEGGIDPLEFRFHAVTDRVATTGAAWLGLTLQCAQCHTHKYDPIQHREYYQIMAFLNNSEEPDYAIPPADADLQLAQRKARRAELIRSLPDQWPAGEIRWQPASIASFSAGPADPGTLQPDSSVLFKAPGPDRMTAEFHLPATSEPISHLKLEALADASLPASGPGRTPHGNFVLSEITITSAGQRVEITGAEASAQQDSFPVSAAFDGNPATGWAVHENGKPLNQDQSATFQLASPAKGPFVIRLAATHGGHHTPGRIRFKTGSIAPGQAPREAAEAAFTTWLAAERPHTTPWTTAKPLSANSNSPTLTIQPDGSILGSGDITKADTYHITIATGSDPVTAIRLEALPDPSLPRHGPGMAYYEGPKGDFFMGEFRVMNGDQPVPIRTATHSYARNNFGGSAGAEFAIDGDPQTGWSTAGGEGKSHEAVFILTNPITPANGQLSLDLIFGRHYACSLGRFRISITSTPDPTASTLDSETQRLLLVPDHQLSADDRATLRTAFLLSSPQLAFFRAQIDALAQPPAWQTTLVMKERPADQPRTTFLHHRGEYTQPEEKVSPAVPAFLPSLPQGAPQNRLGFAQWLVSRSHPLTARVTVNRQWASFFGRGLVRTEEDFGYQGDLPSHPELLDWLAINFMENGWSLKKLHRLIVTSSTYRQSSRFNPDATSRDATNILLWRGPRVRLEAEQIRDTALMATGLLSLKAGGPGVYPTQPAGVTTEGTYGAMAWNPSSGEDRYRRSLYTFVKRTAPFAMTATFDAPSGEACVARRDVSNTPLQSLTLLNDVMFMEAAQAMATRISQQPGETSAKIHDAFVRIFSRLPSPEEATSLASFLQTQEARCRSGDLKADTLTGASADPATAAWTLLIRALLNTDEFVTRN
jgi:hypothetical protein